MNYKQNRLTIDIINILLRFMIAYSIIVVLLSKVDPFSMLRTLCLFPAAVLSYMVSQHAKHLWSFLALHLIMLVIYTFTAPNIFIGATYGFYLLIISIYAYYQKQKTDKLENTSLVFLIIFFILYLISNYFKLPKITFLVFVVAIMYILLYILNMYFLNFNAFLKNNDGVNNLPYQQIKTTSNTLIAFLLSLFFFVMILFAKLPMENLLKSVGKLMLGILSAFFSLFHGSSGENIVESAPQQDNFMESFKTAEPSKLMEIINSIIMWALTILLIIAVIAGLLYILYKLYQYFYAKNTNKMTDKIEFISPFIKKEHLKKVASQNKFRNLFSRTNNDIIRKYFYKSVISSDKLPTELPKDSTPSQLTYYVFGEDENSDSSTDAKRREQLTLFYEKARYSNEVCSKEEVSTVKNILK